MRAPGVVRCECAMVGGWMSSVCGGGGGGWKGVCVRVEEVGCVVGARVVRVCVCACMCMCVSVSLYACVRGARVRSKVHLFTGRWHFSRNELRA